MTDICEGSLVFSFSTACDALKYDDWPFYRKRFQQIFNTKAVDILCATSDAAWLIEVKDYRGHNRDKCGRIEDEVAQKVRDTLAGLAAANANGDEGGRNIASEALNKRRWRVVLHLEQTDSLILNPSNIQIMLRQRLGAVDGKAVVTDAGYISPQMPWTVSPNTVKTT